MTSDEIVERFWKEFTVYMHDEIERAVDYAVVEMADKCFSGVEEAEKAIRQALLEDSTFAWMIEKAKIVEAFNEN